MHGGPFANIAHGCNSLLATRMALSHSEYTVTEAGFGADLGAEKFYDILCRKSGLEPALTVIVATAQGLKMHGGVPLDDIAKPDLDGLRRGLANLDRHVSNLRSFGQTVLVAFNRFAADTDDEMALLRHHCEDELHAPYVVNDAYARGGEGAEEMARLVVDTIERQPSAPLRLAYEDSDALTVKIEKVARQIRPRPSGWAHCPSASPRRSSPSRPTPSATAPSRASTSSSATPSSTPVPA